MNEVSYSKGKSSKYLGLLINLEAAWRIDLFHFEIYYNTSFKTLHLQKSYLIILFSGKKELLNLNLSFLNDLVNVDGDSEDVATH